MTDAAIVTCPAPPPAWAHLPFFHDGWPALRTRLANEAGWLPGPDHVFAALAALAPPQVRVIILGQDPYPTPGHANGLAFSVTRTTPLPRSLQNIFREMREDLGDAPAHGDLSHWARQGVMLLNTSLSVPKGKAGGHATLGWQRLTHEVIAEAQRNGPLAFILWGRHAQDIAAGLSRPQDLVIATPHPSPLSARRGFFGSRPFSRTNAWLGTQYGAEIDWVDAETFQHKGLPN